MIATALGADTTNIASESKSPQHTIAFNTTLPQHDRGFEMDTYFFPVNRDRQYWVNQDIGHEDDRIVAMLRFARSQTNTSSNSFEPTKSSAEPSKEGGTAQNTHVSFDGANLQAGEKVTPIIPATTPAVSVSANGARVEGKGTQLSPVIISGGEVPIEIQELLARYARAS